MARTGREIIVNQPHHVVIKTIPELTLFRDDGERFAFLVRLREKALQYEVTFGDFMPLSTHGHFVLVPSTKEGIANLMRSMLTWWAAHLNRTHENGPRKGKVFQDRYYCKPVRDRQHYLSTSRYVQRNPVNVMPGVAKAEDYLFSSTRIRLGLPAPVPIHIPDDDLVHLKLTGARRGRQHHAAAALSISADMPAGRVELGTATRFKRILAHVFSRKRSPV